LHLLALACLVALVVAFVSTLLVGLFGWIQAAARCLDERTRRTDLLIYLFIATTYTLAAVAALRGLLSLGLA
jgi:hypothetical protein